MLASTLLFSAAAALASPIITSVTPPSGPVTGGVSVTIHGSGFSNTCPPQLGCSTGPIVIAFGSFIASSTQFIDANTITAVTPINFPGAVTVFLSQPSDSAQLRDAFTYVGNTSDAFDRLLLPLMLPPVYGAYGSLFVTNLALWNASNSAMPVYRLFGPCPPITCAPAAYGALPPRPLETSTDFSFNGTPASPGVFLYVPKGSADFLAAELRVQDISRQAQTWGTEIPIVRDRDFHAGMIALLDLPNDDRFRMTLRVYGDQAGTVRVRVVRTMPPSGVLNDFVLQLAPGAALDPAYASFSAFPPAPITAGPAAPRLRVEIDPVTNGLRIWAFISVTNNETQHITLITPP